MSVADHVEVLLSAAATSSFVTCHVEGVTDDCLTLCA